MSRTFAHLLATSSATCFAVILAAGCSETIPQPMSEMERMTELSLKTGNTLEGKATINGTLPIPKGTLLVYESARLEEPSTFCELAPDGGFRMENVPADEFVVVLRLGVEPVPSETDHIGVLSKKAAEKGRFGSMDASKPYRKMPAARLQKLPVKIRKATISESPDFAIVPEPDRWLIDGAFSKFSNQKSPDAVRLKIAPGANAFDLKFQVP